MTTEQTPNTNPSVDTKPNAVPIVPDDWASLGAKSGYDPKSASDLRFLIVGPSGEGKTTFLSSMPDNLILDFDDGANAVPGSNAVRITIKDFAHLKSIIEKLSADTTSGKKRFKRVTIDTIDELIAMIKHHLEEEKKVEDITDYRSEGYGYNLILQRFWSIILDIEQGGYAWAIIGHTRTKTEVDPSTKKPVTRIRDAVYPIISKKILTKTDFKLTIYCIPETVKVELPPKIINTPNGKITVPQSEEKISQVYYVDSLTTDARGTNKGRGVPTMEKKFKIPLINGWGVFKEKYDEAVALAKKKYQ